jgi:hypothetical protein
MLNKKALVFDQLDELLSVFGVERVRSMSDEKLHNIGAIVILYYDLSIQNNEVERYVDEWRVTNRVSYRSE